MNSRDYKIDFMRAFACIMVLFCHAPQYFMGQPGKFIVGIDNYFGMACGPILFFMISGACIFWKEQEAIPFLKKRFSRILSPTIFWSIVYIFLECYWWHTSPQNAWITKIPKIIYEPQYGIMWFMYALVSIYIMTPIISRWLGRCSQKEILLYLLIWGVTLFLPLLKLFGIKDIYIQQQNGFLYYMSGFLWCAVAGYYCRKYVKIKTIRIWHIFIIGFILLSPLYIFIIKRHTGMLMDMSLGILSMPTTILVFIIIYNTNIPHFFNCGLGHKIITNISNLSFGIYLTHMIFMHPFRYWIAQYNINYILQIPITVIVVGVFSYTLTWILSKTKIRTFIIG